jgi:hypothetical protein
MNIVIGVLHPFLALFAFVATAFPRFRRYATQLVPRRPLILQFLGLLIPIASWAFFISPSRSPATGLDLTSTFFLGWSALFLVHSFLTIFFHYGDLEVAGNGRFFFGLPSFHLIVDSRNEIQRLGTSDRLRLLAEALLGYLLIILCFSIVYHCCYLICPNYFYFSSSGLNSDVTYFDFLYFSFVTIATVGYGDISPIAHVVRMCAVAEIILSLTYFPLIVTSFLESVKAQRN